MILTLARRYPSALTYLEEHHALFDQVCPLLEPNIRHNEAFSPLPMRNLPILAKPSRDPTRSIGLSVPLQKI